MSEDIDKLYHRLDPVSLETVVTEVRSTARLLLQGICYYQLIITLKMNISMNYDVSQKFDNR